MTNNNQFLKYILEKLSLVPGLSYKEIKGGYLLYSNNINFGGVYDNKLYVKITKRSANMLPYAKKIKPNTNSKNMLHVAIADNKIVLKELVAAIVQDTIEDENQNK